MMVRHIRLDRRQFYLFEGLGINSLNSVSKPRMLSVRAVYVLSSPQLGGQMASRSERAFQSGYAPSILLSLTR